MRQRISSSEVGLTVEEKGSKIKVNASPGKSFAVGLCNQNVLVGEEYTTTDKVKISRTRPVNRKN